MIKARSRAWALVVVTYFSRDDVDRMLASMADEPFALRVIFDNSADPLEFCELRRVAARHGAIALTEGVNLGYGAAANRGTQFALDQIGASPDIGIMIANPDTVLVTDNLIAAMDSGIRLGYDIATPVVTTGDASRTKIWCAGGEINTSTGTSYLAHWGEFPSHAALGVAPFPTNFASGAAIALTGRAWTRLRGFREDLFMYWEDADLSLRAAEAGLKICVLPDSELWHAVGGTQAESTGKSTLYYYYMHRNRLIVCTDHPLRLLLGRGCRATLYLFWRALREQRKPLLKLYWSVRGIVAGVHSCWSGRPRGLFPR